MDTNKSISGATKALLYQVKETKTNPATCQIDSHTWLRGFLRKDFVLDLRMSTSESGFFKFKQKTALESIGFAWCEPKTTTKIDKNGTVWIVASWLLVMPQPALPTLEGGNNAI